MITNAQLNEQVAAFGSDILHILSGKSNVLLLLNDSIGMCILLASSGDKLIHRLELVANLALAKLAIGSTTFSPKLLPCVLGTCSLPAIIVDANFLPHLLELLSTVQEHHLKIIVVVQYDKNKSSGNIITWAQVEADGAKAADSTPPS